MTSHPLLPTALILGAPLHADGTPSAALTRRARHGAQAYLEGHVQRIIASGGVTRPDAGTLSEAAAMAGICEAMGVPRAHILHDETAMTTAQNIAHALPLLVDHGLRLEILVTDRYHAPRALLVARAHGLCPRASCPPPTGTGRRKLVKAWLREALALPVYALRYRRGLWP